MRKFFSVSLLFAAWICLYGCKSVPPGGTEAQQALTPDILAGEPPLEPENREQPEPVEEPEITQFIEPDFGQNDESGPEDTGENSLTEAEPGEIPDIALVSEPDTPPVSGERGGEPAAEFAALPEAVPQLPPGPAPEEQRAVQDIPESSVQSAPPSGAAPAIPGNVPEAAPFPEEELDSGISPVREPIPLPIRPVPDIPASSPVHEDQELVFSRTVRATMGQLIEIPFRGGGWVFLGELSSRRGVVYDSRRQDAEGQSFIFRTEATGVYILRFYKRDFIRDYIINDHVQVIIGEAPESAGAGWFNAPVDRGRVVAEPRWPLSTADEENYRPRAADREGAEAAVMAAPESTAPDLTGAEKIPASQDGAPETPPAASPAVQGGAFPQVSDEGIVPVQPAAPAAAATQQFTPVTLPPETPPDIYVVRAREEFEAGRVASALNILNQFRERFPSGSDEAYWLYGQLFEANGPNRDIRSALAYYRRLIQEYPQSSRYADARRRIAYLERYYFTIQ
jgi:hypothetical protein